MRALELTGRNPANHAKPSNRKETHSMAEKQTDALEDAGPGVGKYKDKKLEALADKFADCRDEKAALATQMTEIEGKIIERMQEAKIPLFRYSDREVRIKPGKNHIKIKTVKVAEED